MKSHFQPGHQEQGTWSLPKFPINHKDCVVTDLKTQPSVPRAQSPDYQGSPCTLHPLLAHPSCPQEALPAWSACWKHARSTAGPSSQGIRPHQRGTWACSKLHVITPFTSMDIVRKPRTTLSFSVLVKDLIWLNNTQPQGGHCSSFSWAWNLGCTCVINPSWLTCAQASMSKKPEMQKGIHDQEVRKAYASRNCCCCQHGAPRQTLHLQLHYLFLQVVTATSSMILACWIKPRNYQIGGVGNR